MVPSEDSAREPEYCQHCHVAGESAHPGAANGVEVQTHLCGVSKGIGYERGILHLPLGGLRRASEHTEVAMQIARVRDALDRLRTKA